MGARGGAAAAEQQRWSLLQLGFAHSGLNLRPFVDGATPGANWQILFHFLLCSLNNFQKLWLWSQLVVFFRPSFSGSYC